MTFSRSVVFYLSAPEILSDIRGGLCWEVTCNKQFLIISPLYENLAFCSTCIIVQDSFDTYFDGKKVCIYLIRFQVNSAGPSVVSSFYGVNISK